MQFVRVFVLLIILLSLKKLMSVCSFFSQTLCQISSLLDCFGAQYYIRFIRISDNDQICCHVGIVTMETVLLMLLVLELYVFYIIKLLYFIYFLLRYLSLFISCLFLINALLG